MTGFPRVQPGVLEEITQHVRSAWSKRVGGILLGRADEVTTVDAALPARQTEEYSGEIAFPARVWEEAYASLDRFPGARIVGWYHSHPGSGVAFSDYDRRLHAVLFGEPYTVALVLDPVADRMAWFGWSIDLLDGADNAAAFLAPPGARPGPGRGRRATAVALVAVRLAAVGAIGYWVGHEVAPRPSSTVTVQRLNTQLGQERRQIEQLRAALAQAQRAIAAEQDRLRAAQADLDAARGSLSEARSTISQLRAGPRTFVLRYRVRPGDSLWDLAGTFLGDPNRWTEIFRANRELIPDPDRLAVGQVLGIRLP